MLAQRYQKKMLKCNKNNYKSKIFVLPSMGFEPTPLIHCSALDHIHSLKKELQ